MCERCPPCRKIAPFFKDLSTKHENIDFVKIDVDTFPDMAHSFGVKSVPTFWTMNGKNKVTEVSM
jgi:thioredoxin 1